MMWGLKGFSMTCGLNIHEVLKMRVFRKRYKDTMLRTGGMFYIHMKLTWLMCGKEASEAGRRQYL